MQIIEKMKAPEILVSVTCEKVDKVLWYRGIDI